MTQTANAKSRKRNNAKVNHGWKAVVRGKTESKTTQNSQSQKSWRKIVQAQVQEPNSAQKVIYTRKTANRLQFISGTKKVDSYVSEAREASITQVQ